MPESSEPHPRQQLTPLEDALKDARRERDEAQRRADRADRRAYLFGAVGFLVAIFGSAAVSPLLGKVLPLVMGAP